MSTDYKFEGWMGLDADSVNGKLVWQSFEPRAFGEDDVDIEITHCGMCGTDLHSLRSGHGPTPYPVCVGHEIVGKAVRVGSKAEKGIKVGDRVGVGAQCWSCLQADCEECTTNNEQYCAHLRPTYGAPFPAPYEGSVSQGGYGNYARCLSRFVFRIPDGLPSENAASMLCGGITLYSPLTRNGCGPGKKVGIVGVGGLGHYGIIFAKALGADRVVGISRKADKREDALKMGADEYIATAEDKDWSTIHAKSLDLIICTISSPNMPLGEYLSLLRPNGTFVQVGAPEDNLPAISAFPLLLNRIKITGSLIGAPTEIDEMLKLAAERQDVVKPWIQTIDMQKANEAIVKLRDGQARYRLTLVNEKHA